jgi:hypothetical protein
LRGHFSPTVAVKLHMLHGKYKLVFVRTTNYLGLIRDVWRGTREAAELELGGEPNEVST